MTNAGKSKTSKRAARAYLGGGALLAMALLLTACAGWGGASRVKARGLKPGNFQEILERAKEKVFPALIFVKPIVEEYSSGEKTMQQVFGSGVIITTDGLALTNHHVVEKAVKVNCVLSNKEQVSATVIGKDPDTDLALLKLDVPPSQLPLPFGEFADSNQVASGDFVMAMGSPFGFSRSISLGIVSNTRRYLGFQSQYKYNTWLQTDAAINPGNSGGPLVNIEGEIVGINTLGLSYFAENVGFSIPSNVARDIAERLKADGEVKRAWVGVRLQPLRDFFTNTFTDADKGVLISFVEPNSPAESAGVHEGDILLAIGGQAIDGRYVEELPAIRRTIAGLPTDKATAFKLQRGKDTLETPVEAALKGKVEGEDFDCRRWNMTVKEINKFKNPSLYFHRQDGIYVQGVRYSGNASSALLQEGDILLLIDRRQVRTLKGVEQLYNEIVNDPKREKKVLIEVLRNGFRKWLVLDYKKDYEKEE